MIYKSWPVFAFLSLLGGCVASPPLISDQYDVLNQRNKNIKIALSENLESDLSTGVVIRVFVAATETLQTFAGSDFASVNSTIAREIDSEFLNRSSCIYYWVNDLHITPFEQPCALLVDNESQSTAIAENQRTLRSLRNDLEDITRAFIGSVDIALINNEEVVKIRKELHELGELISSRDVAVGEYKTINDQFISDMKERLNKVEALIRAGIPQYE